MYEVHSRAWLHELSGKYRRQITLANIPDEEFAALARLGFTHLWMMGVWGIGREALAHAQNLAIYGQLREHSRLEDVCGSPYAISGYTVLPELGGMVGLERLRSQLHRLGLLLILDFIPNHLALDHPWVSQFPQRFVHSKTARPQSFKVTTKEGQSLWLAHGKDPYFPPWTDTVQLDWRLAEVHQAVLEKLLSLAQWCDGVRVDMAMLVLKEVFLRQWGPLPESDEKKAAEDEFWPAAIAKIRSLFPEFLWIAECYWGLESDLVRMGFDYVYDKTSYDHLTNRRPAELRAHLQNPSHRLWRQGVRFLENHDEQRVGSVSSLKEQRAWALLTLATPGLRLVHHGQMQGFRRAHDIRTRARPAEPEDPEVLSSYRMILPRIATLPADAEGAICLGLEPAWEGNRSHEGIVVIFWPEAEARWFLVVVNLQDHAAQGRVRIPCALAPTPRWELCDQLSAACFSRSQSELASEGLYLDLQAHEAQLFLALPRG